MKVLNLGSINIDYIYKLNHFVAPGETISANSLEINPGGKGLNQSVAMANAGLNVYHAGLVGVNDSEFLINTLQKYNVNTDLISKIPSQTGHAIIQVTQSGENSIILFKGANHEVDKNYIDNVLSQFNAGDYCVLQNEISNIGYIIQQAHSKGIKIVLNPSPCNNSIMSCELKNIDIFILNEVEGRQITGKTDSLEILNELHSRYPHAKIVLTLGAKGSIYKDSSCEVSCGIYKADILDTTAAGDTFTGYFLYGLFSNMPIKDVLEMASRAAAIAVSRQGAAKSIPLRSELEPINS